MENPCLVYVIISVDKNTILFVHDTTSWKALDVHNHGNISKKIDLVKDFAESEKMELNPEELVQELKW